ncbi:anthocyanidin 3-O-glucosyltransferase 5-like [Magnolia sinica]|uniref:anthocyanidin 3-O-glucosyltransferase 5-like n=1 Tax=Magnolia sinica TaxID=86752 RepID=UPI00265B602C|nr:anthocyanidin 3-O-glucosyltransferase 5-like [Magnolia sinica]
MATQNPHVAILPSPGMGHIIPLLEFGKRLATLNGFHVSLFIPTTDASAAQSHFFRSINLPQGLHIIHLPPANVSGLIPTDATIETRLSIIIRESVPTLRSALADLALPTILVVDIFGTDAFSIAEELNIPKYVFFTSTAMLLAFLMYLPKLDVEVTGEYVHLQEPVRIPGCKPIKIENLVDALQDRKNDRYGWMLHHARQYRMAQGILVNTCEGLEPRTIKALREDPILRKIPTPSVHPVGPIIQSEAPLLSGKDCLMWLDRQPDESVIYVSFGSGGTLSAEQMTELAWGLELSRQPFLWVVRPPSGNEKSATYFTSGGRCNHPSEYLPDGFLTRNRGIGLVVPSWGPQREILSHKATGGFLTHCGWNSTLESIVYGVPMIAWPLYAEQKLNASTLTEELKVAVRPIVLPEKEGVGREEIKRVVRLVMDVEDGKALRGRVKEVRDSVLKGLDEGGSSYNSLSHVVDEWKISLQTSRGNVE